MPYERHQLLIFAVATLLPAVLMRRHRSAVFWFAVSAVGMAVSIVYVVTPSLLAEGKPDWNLAQSLSWVVVPIGSLGLGQAAVRAVRLVSDMLSANARGIKVDSNDDEEQGNEVRAGCRAEAKEVGGRRTLVRAIGSLGAAFAMYLLVTDPTLVILPTAVLVPAVVMRGRRSAPLWTAVSALGIVAFFLMGGGGGIYGAVAGVLLVLPFVLVGFAVLLVRTLTWLRESGGR